MATMKLPEFVPHVGPLSRATAQSLNNSASALRQGTLTLNGVDKVIPVVYGEDRIVGLHLVAPRIYSGRLLMAVCWSWGDCEGVQAIYVNGEDLPGTVLVTHYTGTDAQDVDPTLSAAFPGFGDRFAGIAYSVFQFPAGTITGFPTTCQIEAVFKGRKIKDPRNNITQYTTNPGLFIYDFLTDTRYGPGIPVMGVSEVADRCDEIVGGVEVRNEAGINITEGMTVDTALDLLSSYAECLWSYDGEGVLIVPDAPYRFFRNSTATYIDKGGVLRIANINTPRFGYDSNTGEYLGLILEGEATNYILDNRTMDGLLWNPSDLFNDEEGYYIDANISPMEGSV